MLGMDVIFADIVRTLLVSSSRIVHIKPDLCPLKDVNGDTIKIFKLF